MRWAWLEALGQWEGPRPADRWSSGHSHEWFTLDWNAQRLAVFDHDIEAIIQTHAKDRTVAAWLEDTAEAFEEIGEIDLAIDWAKQATDFDRGHQSLKAADYWCGLLEAHRPAEALDARLVVFRKWPSSTSAARLHKAAGSSWPDYRDEVVTTLAASPRDAVLFALLTLKEPEFAWNLAHSSALDSDQAWSELAKAYEKVDPITTLPIHQRPVENELVTAGAQHYRSQSRSARGDRPRVTLTLGGSGSFGSLVTSASSAAFASASISAAMSEVGPRLRTIRVRHATAMPPQERCSNPKSPGLHARWRCFKAAASSSRSAALR